MKLIDAMIESPIKKVFGKCYWIATVTVNTVINKIPSRHFRKLCYRLLGARIGNKSVIFRRVEVLAPYKLTIGQRTSIGWFTLADARGGLTIGDHVTVASYCKLVTAKHDINDPEFKAIVEPIVIEDYAWICTGAIITSGVRIGKGAVVCAGSVVTRDVPAMSVVGGGSGACHKNA